MMPKKIAGPNFHASLMQITCYKMQGVTDSHLIQIKIEASVLEFSAIVTSDVFDLDAIVVHGTVGEASEDILHFSLVEYYVHPCVS